MGTELEGVLTMNMVIDANLFLKGLLIQRVAEGHNACITIKGSSLSAAAKSPLLMIIQSPVDADLYEAKLGGITWDHGSKTT